MKRGRGRREAGRSGFFSFCPGLPPGKLAFGFLFNPLHLDYEEFFAPPSPFFFFRSLWSSFVSYGLSIVILPLPIAFSSLLFCSHPLISFIKTKAHVPGEGTWALDLSDLLYLAEGMFCLNIGRRRSPSLFYYLPKGRCSLDDLQREAIDMSL